MGSSIKLYGRWIILSLLLLCLLIAFLVGDYSNPRRIYFFRYYPTHVFAYVFGFLPKKYYTDYEEYVVENTNNYYLINVVHKMFPAENHNYIIFKEKNKQNPGKLLLNSDSIFYKMKGTKNVLSSQINLETFNRYIQLKGAISDTMIIEYYCFLFSDFGESNYEFVSDINRIKELRRISGNEKDGIMCYKVLKENFVPDFHSYIYFWLEGFGLVEMSFKFKNNELITVQDEFIFGADALALGIVDCDKDTLR